MRRNNHKFAHRILAIFVALGCLAGCVPGFAEESEKQTVYASSEEQTLIRNSMAEKFPGYLDEIEWDSLTPVYLFNQIEDYRSGDVIHFDETVELGDYFYVAKWNEKADTEPMFKDLDPEHRGTAKIYVKNGEITAVHIAYTTLGVSDPWNNGSYAEYAEDIRLALGREEIISPEYVRYVLGVGIGYCFYINDGIDECFVATLNPGGGFPISIPVVPYQGEAETENTIGIVHVGEELEVLSLAIQAAIAERERQPKGTTGLGGTSVDQSAAIQAFPAEHYRQIEDVQAYLGINLADYAMHFPQAFVKRPPVWPILVGAGVVAAAAVVAVLVIVRKKKGSSGKVQAA